MRERYILLALPVLILLGIGFAALTQHPRPIAVATREMPVLKTDAELTKIALGSCADQKLPEPIWDAVVKDKPDLFIFMGDNIYGDVKPDSGDVPELREAYAQLAKIDGFRRLRANVPTLEIWDDHDYGLNDGGAEFPLKDQSKAEFLQFWGISNKSERATRPGLYDSVIVGPEGKRVQIILLDLRWFRDPLTPTDQPGPGKERYVPNPDPALTMLGTEQWAWLEEQFKKPAELRLVISSIQLVVDGHGWERWGNLPAERDKFYALIEKTNANGVVIVSGDRHIGAIYKESAGVAYPLFEMTSSSLNKPATNITDEPGPQRLGPIFNGANYGVVTIDWTQRIVGLTLKDVTGQPVLSASVALASLVPPPVKPKQNSVMRDLLQ